MERREAQICCFASRAKGSASPCGAPQTSSRSLRKLDCYLAAILGEGSVLPGQDKRDTRLDPAGFRRPSSCPRPALDEQSHVVGPDADPSLPDDVCARHARGRRILLRFKSALEKRPSRTGHAELKGGPERGDWYPHHEMLQEGSSGGTQRNPSCARSHHPPSFRGARLREPGIHICDCKPVMDPGLRQAAHPGMTGGKPLRSIGLRLLVRAHCFFLWKASLTKASSRSSIGALRLHTGFKS